MNDAQIKIDENMDLLKVSITELEAVKKTQTLSTTDVALTDAIRDIKSAIDNLATAMELEEYNKPAPEPDFDMVNFARQAIFSITKAQITRS